MRTYLGHLTKRERSRPWGRMAPPTVKERGVEGKRGSALAGALAAGVLDFDLDDPFLGAMVVV